MKPIRTTATRTVATRVASREHQTKFLDACLTGDQPLSEVLDTLAIKPETLADWLASRPFRKRVGGLVRQLRRTRELQIQMAARNAAHMLAEISAGTAPGATPTMRAASADLVRFARDRNAKAQASEDVIHGLTAPTPLFHPGIAPDEADQLMRELDQSARASSLDASAPSSAPQTDAPS